MKDVVPREEFIVVGLTDQQVHECRTKRREVCEDWCGQGGFWQRRYQNDQVHSRQTMHFVDGWIELVLGNLVSKHGSFYHNS